MKRYKIQTLSGDIEFKLLSAEDTDSFYNTLMKDDNPFLEEYIFNSVTDDKYIGVELSAGIIPMVVYLSLKQSGLTTNKLSFLNAIEDTRVSQEKNSYFSIYSKIISYMPSYKLEELREKPFNELIDLLVFVEGISGKHFIDTKKAKDLLLKETENKDNVPVKKGVKSLTKLDLDAIKNAINYNDNSNMI